jgi:PAS domain S-box-containing protein
VLPQAALITEASLDAPGPRVLYVNPAFERMTGWTGQEIAGRSPRVLQGALTDRSIFRDLRRTLAAGKGWSGETYNYRRDGTPFLMSWTIEPILDPDGEIAQFLAIQEDVTERRATQRRLAEAWQAIEAADATKSRFLSVLSHELRTPLNAIGGFAEAISCELLGPLGDPRYREYAKHIAEGSARLHKAVEALLDTADIEIRELELTCETLQSGDVLRPVAEVVRPNAARRGQALELDLGPEVELEVDPRLLRQGVLQLLANAIKFSPEGGTVRLRAGPQRDGSYLIAVQDEGPGIPPAEIPRLLQPFEQLDNRLARTHEGLGLGLFLASTYATLHGGRVKIDSPPGGGTTAQIVLPASRLPVAPT